MFSIKTHTIVTIAGLLLFGAHLQASSSSEKVTIYGNSISLPNNLDKQPNDATLSYYFQRSESNFFPDLSKHYKVEPSKSSVEFSKSIERHKTIDKELKKSAILSYLYYEKGKVIYDALPPEGRFKMKLSNSSYFPSHSMGKSITSYVLGHAICEGYIDSIDSPISDWPLMKDTLYYGQPIIQLLNMTAGDTHVVKAKGDNFNKTGRSFHGGGLQLAAENPKELKNTKRKQGKKFAYSNLTSIVLGSYLLHRTGDDFEAFISNFYQNKIGVKFPVFLEMSPLPGAYRSRETPLQERIKQGAGLYGIWATRYDYLRIAKSMLDDWQNDTCEGKYLKEVYKRRIRTNRRADNWNSSGTRWYQTTFETASKKYGGQFWTDFSGLHGKNVLAMSGFGGQQIVIDMDNSRIVIMNAMLEGRYSTKKLGYEPIRYGRIR